MTGPPKGLFPYVLEFCSSVARDSTPFFMDVEAEAGDQPLDCISNVRRRIAAHGGEPVLGWKIWEWYGIMLEAEFHMVWRTADGLLKDVTPNPLGYKRVLFLPDPSLKFEEKQINNIRTSLIKDARVGEFISVADEVFAIHNAGDRATQLEIRVTPDEARRLQFLEFRKAQLLAQIESAEPERNDRCRCGSGQKYKRCCGRS